MNDTTNNKRNVSLLVIIAVLVLIIAFLGYYTYDLKKQVSRDVAELDNKQQQLEFTYAKLDSISKQLEAKMEEIERLGGNVDSLLSIKKQLEKEKYELKLSKNLATDRYNKIKSKISDYEALLKQKDQEIAQLKLHNEKLQAENQGLKNQTASLSGEVNTLKVANEQLSDRAKAATMLKIKNIQINAMNDNGKERDGGEYKVKHVNKLKVVFQLEENKFAEIGPRRIYLRIIEPEGGAIFNPATGAGKFKVQGQEEVYSSMQEIMFDNSGQSIIFFYDKGADYKKGIHKVELYADGVLIGSSSFTIK